MPYARSYLYISTHIKDMINFVNLSRLITNDKSAGEAADVKIMSKNIPLSGSLLDFGMVNFVISYDSGYAIFSHNLLNSKLNLQLR